MRILGLTGGIASGKSTVTAMFIEHNIPVIDTDQIAKRVLDKDTDAYHEVIQHFTKDILLSDQSINRKKLGQIVFRNKGKRDVLNGIVHPHVYDVVEVELERLDKLGVPLVVIDVPLLFETGFDKRCDKTVVVYTTMEKQVERLIDRDRIDEEFAKMKINAQLSLDEKCDRADFVIDNSHSILDTKKDFLAMLDELEVNQWDS